MKKIIFLLLVNVLWAKAIFAQGFTVKNYHVDITISKDGYFDVEEKYDVDFSEDKHGLWRKLPYIYDIKDTDGAIKKTRVDISQVKVPGWPFKKSVDFGFINIKIGDADRYVIGSQQYTIQYRVKYAFLYNKSNTQFYWNFLGNEWQEDFENVTYSIHLPEYLPLTNKDYFVYTGMHGGNDGSGTIVYSHGVISGAANEVLGNGKDLTVLINLPAGYIAQPSAFEKFVSGYGYLLLPVLLIIGYYLLWRRIGRDNRIIKVVEFQPPPGIDPAMAGFLINDQSDASDLIAFIPHWGAYGYITVEQTEKKGLFGKADTILHKVKSLPANAPDYEAALFNGLFGSGDEVSLNSLRNTFYKTMADAKAKLKSSAMAAGYYTKSSNSSGCMVSVALIIIGFVGAYFLNQWYGLTAVIVWAIVCLILILCSRIFMKRTSKGDEAMQHITGFKMFIEKADKNRLAVLLKEDPTYFEKTMGYALAFGLLTAWGSKFEGLDVQPPNWYTGYGIYAFSPYHFSQSFNDSMSTAQTNLVSAPSSSSSGGGSGGGFSGGGFGGGEEEVGNITAATGLISQQVIGLEWCYCTCQFLSFSIKYHHMLSRIIYACLCLFFFACSSPHYKNPHVRIETGKGDIEVELFPDQAPKSVAAFLKSVDSGYYKNTSFYRILSDENQPADNYKSRLIQGGLWKTKYKLSASLPGIPHENTQQTKLSHTDGTVSFARAAPGTATTEFFICIGDQHGFDYGGSNNPDGQGYAAFGRVVSGMKVVMDIYNAPEDEQDIAPPIDIYNIVRL